MFEFSFPSRLGFIELLYAKTPLYLIKNTYIQAIGNSQNENTLDMEYSELDHFKGKDKIVAAIYARLIDELRKFGPLKLEPKKQVYT